MSGRLRGAALFAAHFAIAVGQPLRHSTVGALSDSGRATANVFFQLFFLIAGEPGRTLE